MIVKIVDDCIRKIDFDEKINLYVKNNSICNRDENFEYNEPIFAPIPYELGQKIRIEVGDNGTIGRPGFCYFDMDIFVNNRLISKKKFRIMEM